MPALTANAGIDKTICNGSYTTIGGSPAATGGAAPYTYLWSPATGLNSTTIANPTANPTANTSYSLTVTDAAGCTSNPSVVVVTVNPLPIVNAGSDVVISTGMSTTIGGTPSAIGGTSPYTYLWIPASSLSASTIANPIATPASSTSYSLTVTDAKGCFNTDVVVVDVQSLSRECVFDEIINVKKLNPDFQNNLNSVNEIINNYIEEQANRSPDPISNNAKFIIPVVVHIIRDPADPIPAITYAQVESEINALNKAFANGYSLPGPLAVNTEIQFCLAQKPTGPSSWQNVAEPGVVRYSDATLANNSFTINGTNALLDLTHPGLTTGGSSPNFPFANYLNIWVVKSIDGQCSGVQGYAVNPLGPQFGLNGYLIDGVVIREDAFGDNSPGNNFTLQPHQVYAANCPSSYAVRNQGKTLVHEIGHYLNLWHTFQNDIVTNATCVGSTSATCKLEGDYCCLTPPSNVSSTHACGSPNPNSCGQPDLVEDFMFYSQDPCWNTFTQDQVQRMVAYLVNFRPDLITIENQLTKTEILGPNGCIPSRLFADFTTTGNLCINQNINFNAIPTPMNTATSFSWTFAGGTPATSNIANPTVQFTTPGNHIVTLTASDGSSTLVNTTTIAISSCSPVQSNQGNWFFGVYAGLNFSSGSPTIDPNAFTAKTINTTEGCITQSDDQGNLLFYSDGVKVWNYNHEEITTTDLYGNTSTSQVLTVPFPGHPGQYYIFYSGPVSGAPANPLGLFYSIIDMNLSCTSCPGGGNGRILFTNTPAILPAGQTRVTESMTAIPSCNGNDYWVIAHGLNESFFYVYSLTSLGFSGTLTPPVKYASSGANYGQMKASPDGTRLAVAKQVGPNSLAIYNFNSSNGQITSNIAINPTSAYGLSFSPNSQLVYYTYGFYDQLAQYDINTGLITILSNNFGDGNQLQLGPDNKIYSAHNAGDRTRIGVINFPDISGLGCSYVRNGVNLTPPNGIMSYFGLPNMIDAIMPPAVPRTFTTNFVSCSNVQFTVDPCWSMYTISWNFGDGSPVVNGLQVNHNYPAPGIYTAICTFSIPGLVNNIQVQQNIQIITPVTAISGSNSACLNSSSPYIYSVPFVNGATYTWSTSSNGTIVGPSNGSQINVNWTSGISGTVNITITLNGCVSNGILNITLNPQPIVTATANPANIVCPETVTLTGAGAINYTWAFGSNSVNGNPITDIPTATTTYNVVGIDVNGCEAGASVTVNVSGILPTVVVTASANTICNGTSTVLTATGANTYTWEASSGTNPPNLDIINVSPAITTTYTVTGTNAGGCTNSASIVITVVNCCTAPSGGITIPPGSNSSAYPIPVGTSVSINGTFTIDNNFSFDNNTVTLGENAKIDVLPGKNLIITSSDFSSCLNMWDGIYLNGNTSTVSIDVSNMKDAEHVVVSIGGGKYTITDCFFNNNYKGVEVRSYLNTHLGTVIGTTFTCTSLKAPRSGQKGYAGITITDVGALSNSDIMIGSASGFLNRFENLKYGVYIINSSVTIQHNQFYSLLGSNEACAPVACPEVGIGIFATNTSTSVNDYSLTIGGSGANEFNTFTQCYQGANANNYANVSVLNNQFPNTSFDPNSATPVGARGVIVRNQEASTPFTLNILDNTITNYAVGINYLLDNQSTLNQTVLNIKNNIISAPDITNGTTGVLMQSIVPGAGSFTGDNIWYVQSNNVSDAGNGVSTINLKKPDYRVWNNVVSIKPGANHNGIRLQGSKVWMDFNSISGPGTATTSLRGIFSTLSPDCIIHCNDISNVGQSMVFSGNNANDHLQLNLMNGANDGLVLLSSGVIGQQGLPGGPLNNKWDGTFANSQTSVNNSDGSLSPFYVTNLPIFNPTVNISNDPGFPPIPFTTTTGPSEGLACPEPVDPCPGGCGGGSFALAVVQDQIDFPVNTEESQWLSKQNVYETLETDTSLMQNEPVLQEFHDSVSIACIGKVCDINEAIGNGDISQAQTINNSIVCNNILEHNHKVFNSIYLRTHAIGADNLITLQDVEQLQTIADQCPLTGGLAVYQARVFLDAIQNTVTEYYSDDCSNQSSGATYKYLADQSAKQIAGVKQGLTNSVGSVDNLKLSLYPNPNDGNMTLKYQLKNTERAELEITDIVGKVICKYTLLKENQSINISCDELKNGIYLYRVFENGVIVKTDKITVIQ